METFSLGFRAGNLELSASVTEYDHHQKFKVEMLRDEPDPILLSRSQKGEWTVAQPGSRKFSNSDFQELEDAIEVHLNEIHGVQQMLVLTDFSEEASNAASYAVGLAHQLKTRKLIFYHSYESFVIPPVAFTPLTGGLNVSSKLSNEKLNELKNELQDRLPEATEIDLRTDDRNLIGAVNTQIDEENIGLVVAGISGKSGLEKALVGSNAMNLAKACHAPLLIVPAAAAFQPIKTVVFACDLKQVSKSTPAFAIKSLVHALAANLLILNVEHDRAHLPPGAIKEMSDLHRLWDDEQVEFHYTHHENKATGIMEFAGQQRAELLVAVPKEYGFFEHIFHHNMTDKLAYHSHLPLLLFR